MGARLIAEIELPAFVRVRGAWFYVLATHGELILDYAAYDPAYDPGAWDGSFRGNLLTVLPTQGFQFLSALQDMVFPMATVESFVELNGNSARPVVAIDFDSARFVSSFYDQALETLCGNPWRGLFGDPMNELPAAMAGLFVVDG